MRPTDSKESIARGESVYKSHCAICHFAASTEKKIGPGLKGLSKRVKFADGTRNDNQNLVKLIENGGKNMPQSRENISDAQLRDLLAYLRTL
jgi:cytochrome c